MKKISTTPKQIALEYDGVNLNGELYRIDSQLLCLKAKLGGELELLCDRSGESYRQALDNDLVLYISDGLWDVQSQRTTINNLDIIEFFDGFVDLDYILQSEVESIKADYHTKE